MIFRSGKELYLLARQPILALYSILRQDPNPKGKKRATTYVKPLEFCFVGGARKKEMGGLHGNSLARPAIWRSDAD
jgi:hypothetical protein